MAKVVKKITDVITIAFPAILAVFGALSMSGAVSVGQSIYDVVLIALGALSTIASIVYNVASAEEK